MSRRTASRLELIGTSPTIAIKMEAERLRSEGKDVIDFGPGEPDFDSPEVVKQAAAAAIAENFTHYTSAAGIAPLRQAIADYYNERVPGAAVEASQVITGVGGKQVLLTLMLTLVNVGDDVLIPAPYWVSFPEQVKLAGGNPVYANLSADDGFTLRADVIAAAVTPATRMIILNSPSNPSGAVLPRAEAEALRDLALDRDLWIVSDETYESFVYDPQDSFSMLELRESLGERLIYVSSFSKTWAMTGWRIGYAIAAPHLVKAMLKIQSHDTTHATSISQKAAIAALSADGRAFPDKALEIFRERRGVIVEGLNQIPGVRCPEPRGAFYAYPDLTGLMKARGFASSHELCRALIAEQGVATVPGEAFGTPGHARFSYATSMDNIREGLRRVETFARG